MNPSAYVEIAGTELRHWWFSILRAILSRMIRVLALPHHFHTFRFGISCGIGDNLDMLGALGNV